MAIPYYQGVTLPFVASIVIGAIQLGATVDYAILMTSNYQKQRHLGKTKKESISIPHKISIKSINETTSKFIPTTKNITQYSNQNKKTKKKYKNLRIFFMEYSGHICRFFAS